ncbi:MAG: acyltransferase [Rikenellaceae bacterium]|nr:acyltransferase [Rikenellaceae bacterium]
MNAEMCLIPLTLCSGMIEGVEQWESYKALRKAMKTGKAQEVYAAGAAIMRDMRDPKKAKAYNEGMRRAEISARMGVYELACVMIVFPAIVWLAASGETTDKISSRVCQFLGDISYPLYIVHYPVMYLFYAWLIENQLYSHSATWPAVIMVFAINITLAYACLKLYDEPVRRWLTKRFIKPTK